MKIYVTIISICKQYKFPYIIQYDTHMNQDSIYILLDDNVYCVTSNYTTDYLNQRLLSFIEFYGILNLSYGVSMTHTWRLTQ